MNEFARHFESQPEQGISFREFFESLDTKAVPTAEGIKQELAQLLGTDARYTSLQKTRLDSEEQKLAKLAAENMQSLPKSQQELAEDILDSILLKRSGDQLQK